MIVSCKVVLTFWVCLTKQKFTHVIKYFNIVSAFVFYCDAKYSGILQGSSHVCCYLFPHSLIYLFHFYMKINKLHLLMRGKLALNDPNSR